MGCVFDQLLGLILDYHWAMSLLIFSDVVGNRMGSFYSVLAVYNNNGDDILVQNVRLGSILCVNHHTLWQSMCYDW